jgi:hypothetical protein
VKFFHSNSRQQTWYSILLSWESSFSTSLFILQQSDVSILLRKLLCLTVWTVCSCNTYICTQASDNRPRCGERGQPSLLECNTYMHWCRHLSTSFRIGPSLKQETADLAGGMRWHHQGVVREDSPVCLNATLIGTDADTLAHHSGLALHSNKRQQTWLEGCDDTTKMWWERAAQFAWMQHL